jgi:hypothetical protein
MAKSPGLDHIPIAVKNLDAAKVAFEKVGFTVTPRGVHVGWGTANHLIVLQDQYIELVGAFGQGADNRIWDQYAQTSEGVWELGFKTSGARKLYQELTEAGVPMDAPYDYSRPIHLEGRDSSVDFVVCYVGTALSLPTRAFLCEHKSPRSIWRLDWTCHANGCRRVLRVDVAATDPGRAADHYSRLMQGRPEKIEDNGMSICTSNTEIRILPDTEPGRAPGRSVWLEVDDLATARALLTSAGVSLSDSNQNYVGIPGRYTCGVNLIFAAKIE